MVDSTGGLKGQVCSSAYELAATWRWLDFGPEEPKWTLAYGWCCRWQHYKYQRGYYYYYYYTK